MRNYLPFSSKYRSPTSLPRTCVRCPRERTGGLYLGITSDTRQRKLSHDYSLPRRILFWKNHYRTSMHVTGTESWTWKCSSGLSSIESSYYISEPTREVTCPKDQEKAATFTQGTYNGVMWRCLYMYERYNLCSNTECAYFP